MVQGVTEGYEKRLEIQGVGYRAQQKGKNLELALGYSHPVPIAAPDGIEFEVPSPTEIVVRGISKQLVGETAAQDPQAAPAGALQGQGHPLQGRVRGQEGRQARMSVTTKAGARLRRRRRVRAKVRGSAERPRLSVFRSNRGMVAQLIDDDRGHTLAAVSLDRARPARVGPHGAGEEGRRAAGRAGPRRPASTACVFDRGGYRFHGRVKALADGARGAGLTF